MGSRSYQCSSSKFSEIGQYDAIPWAELSISPTYVTYDVPCIRRRCGQTGNARLREVAGASRKPRYEGFRVHACTPSTKSALRSSGWRWCVLHDQRAVLVLLPHTQARDLVYRLVWYRQRRQKPGRMVCDKLEQERERCHEEVQLMQHRCGQPILVTALYKTRLAKRGNAFTLRYQHQGLTFSLEDCPIPVSSCPKCHHQLSLLALAFRDDRACTR